LWGAIALAGCQSPKSNAVTANSPAQTTRDNAYSLLHELLDEEKHVSLLRFVKHENPELKTLVKRIAARSKAGSTQLEQFAKKDPSLHLDQTGLPPGEVATRKAIADTKKNELLSQSGDEFELSLLLSQTEALRYGAHLAKVAGDNDSQQDRAKALTDLHSEMEQLYHETFAMIASKRLSSPKPVASAPGR